jgi:hypothetical protein
MIASLGPSPNFRNFSKVVRIAALLASIAHLGGAAADHHNRAMAGLLQPAQGHDLKRVADVQAGGGGIEADIAGDPFLAEQSIQIGGRRAVVIGSARRKVAKEIRLE